MQRTDWLEGGKMGARDQNAFEKIRKLLGQILGNFGC